MYRNLESLKMLNVYALRLSLVENKFTGKVLLSLTKKKKKKMKRYLFLKNKGQLQINLDLWCNDLLTYWLSVSILTSIFLKCWFLVSKMPTQIPVRVSSVSHQKCARSTHRGSLSVAAATFVPARRALSVAQMVKHTLTNASWPSKLAIREKKLDFYTMDNAPQVSSTYICDCNFWLYGMSTLVFV